MKNVSWKEERERVKMQNISEEQYYTLLKKHSDKDIPEEILRLITNHVYHSSEDKLYAPPHLRLDVNGNYPRLSQE